MMFRSRDWTAEECVSFSGKIEATDANLHVGYVFGSKLLGGRGLRGDGAAEAEGVGVFAKGGDAEGDVLFERDAQLSGAFADVVAADAFGEGLVFHAALHGIYFQIEDAFRGANVGAGGEKASQFIAGEEGALEQGLARHIAVVCVREDGADDFLGVTTLAKDFGAFGGVVLFRSVGFVWPALVVEVVQQGGDAPELFIGDVLAGIGADAGFHGQHVLAEALGLRVFAQQLPGVFACGHGLSFRDGIAYLTLAEDSPQRAQSSQRRMKRTPTMNWCGRQVNRFRRGKFENWCGVRAAFAVIRAATNSSLAGSIERSPAGNCEELY